MFKLNQKVKVTDTSGHEFALGQVVEITALGNFTIIAMDEDGWTQILSIEQIEAL